MIILLTSLVFALLGLALAAGGIFLAVLGGSPFYLLIGGALLLTAYLVYRRRHAALAVHGVLILAALGWAVWEVGLDWWQLAPRGGLLVVLGLWLLMPWVWRRLDAAPRRVGWASTWPLAAPLAIAVVVAGYAMTQDPHDIAGALPTTQTAAAMGGSVPDSDWHQYGRTPYGQRYSPLDTINTDNVSTLKVAWQYQTGDVKLPQDVGETTYQVTPLKVGDTLYLCTPHN